MTNIKIAASLLLAALITAALACTAPEPPLPTHTPYPTQAALPTHTPYPTQTQLPTYTPFPTRTPAPTATAYPTQTALPTYTPYPTPTNTPVPTATPTPRPTFTPLPTVTRRPTNTPRPMPTPTSNPYGKWQYNQQDSSGDTLHVLRLYAQTPRGVYMVIFCSRGDEDEGVNFNWGQYRPIIGPDSSTLPSLSGSTGPSHPVQVRYGNGLTQSETWYRAKRRDHISLPGAFIGEGAARLYQYRQVDTLTVGVDTDKGPIEAEFDLRGLVASLSRLNQHCP